MSKRSEYQWCGCRDCFDVAVGTVNTLTLCGLCEEAGCEIGEGDCQREETLYLSSGDCDGEE
ncbi:hypothetical protein OHB26_03210 [Nocardia sp. NBC_01503]|uniref:hypothetical protein n=1 Tax=Nocardia sp. NBC_01503 TaxID=2975997 RepID=UPI002E7C317F|nr:hypothetical protein [Nocardia sp. NBC_01503]WTL33273.1 hypothetical protein OHB26_03210 [Nocardia sp. NBC_01503]